MKICYIRNVKAILDTHEYTHPCAPHGITILTVNYPNQIVAFTSDLMGGESGK